MQPGETVKARVTIKEAGQLSDVSIGFSNDTRGNVFNQ